MIIVCVCMRVCHGIYVEVINQLARVIFPFYHVSSKD